MQSPNAIFEEATNAKRAMVKKWGDKLAPVAEAYKIKYGRPIAPHILENTAMTLESTEDWVRRQRGINENTYSDAVAFVNYGFRVISALMPSLIANDIVSVQPMDRRTGQIFYLNYVAGSTKGNIAQGTTLMSATTGPLGNTNYSSDTVPNETLVTGNGSTKSYTGISTQYNTIIAGSVVITTVIGTSTALTLTDNGSGVLVGSVSGNTGTIVYSTGAVTLSLTQNVPLGTGVLVTYRVDQQRNTAAIPELDLDIVSATVTAKTRKLAARWLLDAAYDLQKAHGITAESELLVAITSEVKYEIDVEITNALLSLGNSSGNTVTFNAQLPTVGSSGTVFPWVWQKEQLHRTFAEGAQKIFLATKRATGNFIICAPDVFAIISTMEGFKSDVDMAAQPPSGPYRAGSINGLYTIYVTPFYEFGQFVIGFKGDSFLNAGYVYAPYLPIFVTPTIILDDFIYRRGVATSYGTYAVNGLYYVGGTVTNLS
jgi:hypothetical protein